MRRRKIKIVAWFLLFAFLLTTVGVNVRKMECRSCRMAYVEVHVFPGEKTSSCDENCACCHSCEKSRQSSCEHENSEHDFYKLSGDWALSHVEILFSDLPCLNLREWFVPEVLTFSDISCNFLFSCIDRFHSQESLCIFRC